MTLRDKQLVAKDLPHHKDKAKILVVQNDNKPGKKLCDGVTDAVALNVSM